MTPLLLCSAILVLLYAGLSFNVSRMRRRKRRLPEMPEVDLTQAIRAHGNAGEYIPLFVAVFLYLHLAQPSPSAYLVSVAMLATVSRLAHAAGMLRTAERHPLRYFGAVGTYVSLFALGGALLARAF